LNFAGAKAGGVNPPLQAARFEFCWGETRAG